MGAFKKYDGSVWQSINPKQLKGIPYTGTLPAVLTGTKAGYLHRYKIYGNLSQNGTPTPENPIVPSECGERTRNLYSSTLEQGTTAGGTLIPASNRVRSGLIYLGTGQFTFSCFNNDDYQIAVDYHLSDGTYSSGTSWLTTKTFELTNQTPIIRLKIRKPDDSSIVPTDVSNIMLNTGSTPLPYEPYGYKLPLLSGSTPVDIYLGESQTTRRIKKLVLTGQEGWQRTANGRCYYIDLAKGCPADYLKSNIVTVICSHYEGQRNTSSGSNEVDEGCICFFTGGGFELYIGERTITTVEDFKTYLQQQYANGTPVTIWYVLAKPETGIVNEPLMKIGDYADTIDSMQSTVLIPTTAGETTISWAGEGLAPSQFDSIQEWVDIPTYKRVNGEWVEE